MFNSSPVRAVLFVSALLLSLSTLASADISALTSFSGGIDATSANDQLYGWVFIVNTPITVSALGVYDYTGTGLQLSHDVGIFTETGESLVGSTTVPNSTAGTLVDGFRYESVTPFSLTQGDTYVIVMTMPGETQDRQAVDVNSVSTAMQITYVTAAFGVSSTLAFTAEDPIFAPGMFGPNFTFTATAVTPEPDSYAALILGFGGFMLVARSRRAKQRQ